MRGVGRKDSTRSRSAKAAAVRAATEKKEPFFNRARQGAMPAMRVSQPEDRAEIEAERSADRVVERLSTPFFSVRKPESSEEARTSVIGRGIEQGEPIAKATDNQDRVEREAAGESEGKHGAEISREPAEADERAGPQGAEADDRTDTFRQAESAEDVAPARQEDQELHASREESTQPVDAEAGSPEAAADVELSREPDRDPAGGRNEDQVDAPIAREATDEATAVSASKMESTTVEQAPGAEIPQRNEEGDVSATASGQTTEAGKDDVRPKANGPITVSPELQFRIQESKGRGHALPLAVQTTFGAAFGGRDFSKIRIHTGSEAARLSADLNARAFAHGRDVYFAEGLFNPDTRAGQHLLAHELTHTIQTGNAPLSLSEIQGSFLADLLEQIKLSNREAREAKDPRPAVEARKQADADGKKALADAKNKPVAKKSKSASSDKPPRSEPRVAKATRRAATPVERPQDGPAKGVVGEYLDEQSKEVCADAAQKSQRLADNESAHDPAGRKLNQTEAAVQRPEKENQSRNEAAQVRSVQSAGDPAVSPAANHAALNTAIEASVPESIEELNEFESEGKGKVVGNAVLGAVKADVGTVEGTYKKIEDVEPASPPPAADPLPVVESAPGTGKLDLGKGAVPDIAEEHTDFSAVDRQSDDLLQQEQITDEQLAMVDSGDLAVAHQERQGLKQKVQDSPAEAKQFAVDQAVKVEKDMQAEERVTRDSMRQKRNQGLAATEAKQKATKTEFELKREKVTKEINRRFEAVKSSVTKKLNALEKTSLATFDREQKRYSILFEQDVRRRVNRWKDKRYSGVFAGVKWLKDKIVGIDHFPEVKRAFATARGAYVRNIDQLIRNINDANAKVIAACREELRTTRESVQEYIDGLEPGLKKAGQTALKDMKAKLKELEGFIDKRKEELQNKLCEKKDQAIEAIDRKIEEMKSEMSGALSKLGNLLLKAALKFFKWALEKAGLKPKALLDVINKGAAVIKAIVTSPIKFFKNLAKAVGDGIGLFVKNIKKHLLNGMMNWLTGQMGEAGITLPSKFDLKGIFSIVLQILGLTWANIRKKLVKRVGERAVAVAEKSVDIVKRVKKEGPIALWHMIKDKAAEIKGKIIAKIRDWVIVQVVKKAVAKIAMMLNPVGAIVQAAIAIYDLVMFFVENIKRIIEFVKSVLNSIAKIAAGAVGAAAAFIEGAMARTVPIILSFLARFFGLSGIGKVVKKIIKTIRKPVDKVVDKALNFVAKLVRKVVGKAKAFGKKVKAKVKNAAGKVVGKLKRWWLKRTPFKVGGEQHHLFFSSKKPDSAIMVASKKQEVEKFLNENKPTGSEGELAAKYGAAKAQLAKVETERKKLSDAMRKSKTLTQQQQDANSKLLKEWNALKDRLEKFMAALEANSTHAKTEIDYASARDEHGVRATAWPLTIKGDPGSTPGFESAIWQQVRERATGNGSYYIRGHLINDNLHGPGNDPRNLTPISQKANSQHKVDVEEKVKDVVWNRLGKDKSKNPEGKAVKYQVDVIYGGEFKPNLTDMKTKIANATQDESRKKDLEIIVEEEQKLASKFLCSAEIVDRIDGPKYKKSGQKIALGNGGLVENHVPDTVPELRGEPPRVVTRLSLSHPGSSKSEAVKALSIVPGVDESRATAIYNARFVDKNGNKIDGRDFESYADLEARAAGVGSATIEALKNYRFRGKKIVVLTGETTYDR